MIVILVAVKVAAALALFGALFFALFWTPGLLLGAFAVGFAADSVMQLQPKEIS